MKKSRKTLYFDIATEAKVMKLEKKFFKQKVSKSHIVSKFIHMTPFDKMVEELNEELKNN